MTETVDTYELSMSRVFDAPRELVYRAFIDPDQFAAWFGPVGWSVPRESLSVDARIGGRMSFLMVNDAGEHPDSPSSGTFVELVENEVIVSEEDVSGMEAFGGVTTMRLRLEFHDEPDGRTRLELRQGPFPVAMRGMSEGGWGSAFTKLDAMLAA